MAARISPEDFSTMLVHSLLFEERVVIPDVYFFNSPYLLSHLRESRGGHTTLLEIALERGLVRPAVRQPAETFTDIIGYLRRAGIFGLLSTDDADYVAGRLDQSIRSRPFELVWPERMAVSYQRLLERVLGANAPPGFGAARISPDVWSATDKYRVGALKLATTIANQREGNYGIRRADVLRAVAIITGAIVRSGDATPTEDAIIGSASQDSDVVSRFIDWLDELYFANQSQRFRLQASTNSQHAGDLGLVASAIGLQQARAEHEHQVVDVEIDIPALSTLVALKPGEFLDLREAGRDWYGAIHRFLLTPSSAHRYAAERSLEEFARSVRQTTRGRPPGTNGVKAGAVAFGGAVAAAAADLTMYELNGPPVAVLGTVVATGFVLHRWLRTSPTETARVRRVPVSERFLSMDPD